MVAFLQLVVFDLVILCHGKFFLGSMNSLSEIIDSIYQFKPQSLPKYQFEVLQLRNAHLNFPPNSEDTLR